MFTSNFFIDIGVAVLLSLLSGGVIPAKYVRALLKLRDALNLAFPNTGNLREQPAEHVRIVK